MRVGVFTPLLSQLSPEDVFKKLQGYNIDTVELGTGNYPGGAHCKQQRDPKAHSRQHLSLLVKGSADGYAGRPEPLQRPRREDTGSPAALAEAASPRDSGLRGHPGTHRAGSGCAQEERAVFPEQA